MRSSLSQAQKALLYNAIKDLVFSKSKFIKDNHDGTSGQYFNDFMIELATSEVIGYVCDYIYRPDLYLILNPTLQFIVADIIIDFLMGRYKEDNPTGGGIAGDVTFAGGIKEIKVGNATVQVNPVGDADLVSSRGNGNDLLKDYKNRLNRYRRPI